MRKSNLEALPPARFPEGYVLRHFTEGDQAAWNALIDLAFGREPGTSDFDRNMRAHPEFRAERVLIVEHANTMVATASAWHRPVFGPQSGYVHWVATHPNHRGHKLGYWASLAALHLMRAEGRTAAMLHTDDFRLAALRTYLQMGFEPVLDDPSHRARWRAVLVKLDWPDRFEATLAGPLGWFVRRLHGSSPRK